MRNAWFRIHDASLLLGLLIGCSAASASAVDCAELRDSVESGMRSRGVTDFAVTIVATDAPAPGQVVGSCEQGAKKLVYTRSPDMKPAGQAAKAPSAVASAVTPAKAVITECADGRVIAHGSCRK